LVIKFIRIIKKQILALLLFSLISYSYGQVGIDTPTPQATLDVLGKPTVTTSLDGIIPPRLTGDELGSKTYTAAQTGAVVYVTAAKSTSTNSQVANVLNTGLYYFNGTEWLLPISKPKLYFGAKEAPLTGTTVNIDANGYTGYYLDLPTGEFLVSVQMLCAKANPSVTGVRTLVFDEGYFIKTSFSDSNTTYTLSPDILTPPNGPTLISKEMVGPGNYYIMNGFVRIKNTSTATKRYYYWKLGSSQATGGSSALTNKIYQFGGNGWGENLIYATPTY